MNDFAVFFVICIALFSNSAVYTVIECVTFSFAETKVLNFNSETSVSD